MKFLRFFKAAIITNFHSSIVLKTSFIINVIVAVIKQALFLISWNFFFDKYSEIRGWSFHDLVFAYGLLSIGIGVVEIFFYGLKDLPDMISASRLDGYIIQPQNLLMNIALSQGRISSVGDLTTGIILVIYSKYFPSHFVEIIYLIPLCIIFIFTLHLYLGSIGFYLKNSSDFIKEIHRNAIIMASQPNIAYRGLLQTITFTFIPVSLISFFPIQFIRSLNYKYLLISYLGNIVFLIIAVIIFNKGIKKYESSNIFNSKI